MADMTSTGNGRPIAIAPALMRTSSTTSESQGTTMAFTCQTCSRRKVKCDKLLPVCSTCRKGRLECHYQAPPPRKRKRPNNDQDDKIARYEQILQDNGLLPEDHGASPSSHDDAPRDMYSAKPLAQIKPEQKPTTDGTLLAVGDRSRYISSHLWRDLGEDEMQRIEEDQEDQEEQEEDYQAHGEDEMQRIEEDQEDQEDEYEAHRESDAEYLSPDPITGALLGTTRDLLNYHPNYADAMKLWRLHIRNVEPLCRVLHIPSVAPLIDSIAQQPVIASKADECLLFAIYHFAIVSITDGECAETFMQPRAPLQARYNAALRQALVNAGLLKTTEIPVMQAFILFLLASRPSVDAQTFWILTGVAMRTAQRMGLHRDGEALGLSPYDVQMRRRLWFQLLPLDGMSAHMAGTGISLHPSQFDTKPPLNVNDDQIFPGMIEWPEVQNGATDMIFCLVRAELGAMFAYRAMVPQGATWRFKDDAEVEGLIDELENTVETKYVRYCDIVNPLHLLVLALARASTSSARLRVRLKRGQAATLSPPERRALYTLARKVIDTDCSIHGHQYLHRFRWHIMAFFQWDAFILVLTTLRQGDILTAAEVDDLWDVVDQMYNNHAEILEMKRPIHIAAGRLTLKAWNASPPSNSHYAAERPFLARLRSRRKVAGTQTSNVPTLGSTNATTPALTDSSVNGDFDAIFGGFSGVDLSLGPDFSIDNDDWAFWDSLIKDNQPVVGGQQSGLT